MDNRPSRVNRQPYRSALAESVVCDKAEGLVAVLKRLVVKQKSVAYPSVQLCFVASLRVIASSPASGQPMTTGEPAALYWLINSSGDSL